MPLSLSKGNVKTINYYKFKKKLQIDLTINIIYVISKDYK